jgi:hypothetical protein
VKERPILLKAIKIELSPHGLMFCGESTGILSRKQFKAIFHTKKEKILSMFGKTQNIFAVLSLVPTYYMRT